jgi:hypothetical protein
MQFGESNDDNHNCQYPENNGVNSNTEEYDIGDYEVVDVFYPGFASGLLFFPPVDKINADCSQ